MCKHVAKMLLECERSEMLLGAKESDVTDAVHANAVQLALRNIVWRTTLKQRMRSHLHERINAPAEFVELMKFGYVAPNLGDAPLGYTWRRDGRTVCLTRRGG